MSLQHLSTGSQDVPIQDGKLRLYSMRFCPYAQRVHLVLNAKNIPHDIVYINLKSKPEWYLERISSGKVPAIAIDGVDLYESLILADFLDEKYPSNPLHRKNPLQRALDKLLIERFSRVTSVLYKIYASPTIDSSLFETLFEEMDYFENELSERGTPYFSGEQPGMVDYMIWPWSERLEMIKVLTGEKFKIPKDRFPKTFEWSKRMLDDGAVKSHYVTPEQHAKFLKSYKTGTPDYDNIL